MTKFQSMTEANELIVFRAIEKGDITLQVLQRILPPTQLQCAQLRFFNNKSYNDIGQIRKCFSTAARLNVKEAMVKIKKYLDENNAETLPTTLNCVKHDHHLEPHIHKQRRGWWVAYCPEPN